RPMTQHGMVEPSATGAQPAATDRLASMVVTGADRVASGRAPGRATKRSVQIEILIGTDCMGSIVACLSLPTVLVYSHRLWVRCFRGQWEPFQDMVETNRWVQGPGRCMGFARPVFTFRGLHSLLLMGSASIVLLGGSYSAY